MDKTSCAHNAIVPYIQETITCIRRHIESHVLDYRCCVGKEAAAVAMIKNTSTLCHGTVDE